MCSNCQLERNAGVVSRASVVRRHVRASLPAAQDDTTGGSRRGTSRGCCAGERAACGTQSRLSPPPRDTAQQRRNSSQLDPCGTIGDAAQRLVEKKHARGEDESPWVVHLTPSRCGHRMMRPTAMPPRDTLSPKHRPAIGRGSRRSSAPGTARSVPVRDLAGDLSQRLAAAIAAGAALARLPGREHGDSWRGATASWKAETSWLLERSFPREVAIEFHRAVTPESQRGGTGGRCR